MCVLLKTGDDRCRVVGQFEGGRTLSTLQATYPVGQDVIRMALDRKSVQWIDNCQNAVGQEDGEPLDALRQWLFKGDTHLSTVTLLMAPLQEQYDNIGALLFILSESPSQDRVMLTSCVSVYALHVGLTYTHIKTTQAMAKVKQQFEDEISERIKAETSLRRSEEQFRNMHLHSWCLSKDTGKAVNSLV